MTPSNQRIEEQAAHWAIRLSEGLSAQETDELNEWLRSDTRHRGALLYAQAIWQDQNRLDALAGHRKRAVSGPARHGLERELSESRTTEPQRPNLADRQRTSHSWRAFAAPRAAAAAIVLSLCGVAFYVWHSGYLTTERYQTPVGGTTSVPLQDGSQIILNTRSSIRVEMTPQKRYIDLQGGEAFFEVAKDSSRPFVVQAGKRRVVAVGTKFSVRRENDELQVVVTEGKVRLEGDDDSNRAGNSDDSGYTVLEAGQAAHVTANGHLVLAQLPPAATQRQLAWRAGNVEFDGDSLGDAVAEINRYNLRQIKVDDPGLAARAVVGVFPANDPRGFASTIAAVLDALAVDDSDAIHLSLRAELHGSTQHSR